MGLGVFVFICASLTLCRGSLQRKQSASPSFVRGNSNDAPVPGLLSSSPPGPVAVQKAELKQTQQVADCPTSYASCASACQGCNGQTITSYSSSGTTSSPMIDCTCSGGATWSKLGDSMCTKPSTALCTQTSGGETEGGGITTGDVTTGNVTQTGSSTASGGSGCFPAGALVTLPGGERAPMESLRLGDRVVVSPDGRSEEIVFFAVRSARTETQMVRIKFENGQSVTASHTHLIYRKDPVEKVAVPVRMEDVNMGDRVVSSVSGVETVVSVEKETASVGLFGPVTASGTVMVDGVLFSVYAGIGPRQLDAWLPVMWSPLVGALRAATAVAGSEAVRYVSDAVWGDGQRGYALLAVCIGELMKAAESTRSVLESAGVWRRMLSRILASSVLGKGGEL
uniref:Hint domain-containing protein n=1 Tax=Chromera velia CCMP2878 TaxID=1169474 RepID=A0A0G4HSU1_9ALVE|eukprot:Cvel_1332.t1-p1 / transcript=Cvel_1332.t1 / gene=Cvel_1332 / organism=Chromera_velia_CCMP2878 / gene_product=Protein hedgehog, putative / transcript_product=Protein hedgehog, putative / location=Cvel_scaffold45:118072-119259(+) / protein_length=396 / sequence_SO=supercontig / SO=protein_coding / is_pseudo=false